MKFTLLAMGLLIVAVVKCSSSTTPERCCTAEQFQISYGGVVGVVVESSVSALQQFFNGAFDFKGRQYGMDVYVHNYGSPDLRYQVIQLFNKGEEYVILDGVCQKIAFENEPQRCVPASANYTTSFYLGNQALLVDDWYQSGDPSQGVVGDSYATTSRDHCTPGATSFVGTVEALKEQLTAQGTYMNFTKGITDPDHWFVPPPSCNNATFLTDRSSWPLLQHWTRMRATQMLL